MNMCTNISPYVGTTKQRKKVDCLVNFKCSPLMGLKKKSRRTPYFFICVEEKLLFSASTFSPQFRENFWVKIPTKEEKNYRKMGHDKCVEDNADITKDETEKM